MKLKELRGLFQPGRAARLFRARPQKPDDRAPVDFRYKVQKDGKDAMFLVGAHRFLKVSQVQKSDPDYLDWILSKDNYPEEIKEIIRYIRNSPRKWTREEFVEKVLGKPVKRKFGSKI